jgi:putative FmdB family regulatory protein
MPTYEYVCRDCGHTFEKFQSITADPVDTCPVCSGRVERLIGPGGGLIFKGSGFYITDYRSEDYRKKAKAESGDTGKSAGKSAEKSDTKKSETTAPKTDSGKSD